jgi:PmbA protein
MQSTGHAGSTHNLTISSNTGDLASLLKTMGTGILLTELMGQGASTVTGDYSRGASGFWVENGEIQYPINEFTVASNLIDMFLNTQLIANDIDDRGSIHTGSWLIDNMTIAGS